MMTLQIIRCFAYLTFAYHSNLLPYGSSRRKSSTGNPAFPIMMVFPGKFFSSVGSKARDAAVIPGSSTAFSYLKMLFANLADFAKHSLLLFWSHLLSAFARARTSFCSQMRVWSGKGFAAGAAYQLTTSSGRIDLLEIHYDK
jgi:hypothetical protein